MEWMWIRWARCRLVTRPAVGEVVAHPRALASAGQQVLLRPLFVMGAHDAYPWEWVLTSRDPRALSHLVGRYWIASGDVEVIEVVEAVPGLRRRSTPGE